MKRLVIVFAAAVTLGLFSGPAFSQDTDGDGIADDTDNCIATPNGPTLGTCTSGTIGTTCTMDAQCGMGGYCSLNQEDTYPPDGNAIGDEKDAPQIFAI